MTVQRSDPGGPGSVVFDPDAVVGASNRAAAAAQRYENRIRLTAEVIPELQKDASKSLEELDPLVREELGKYLNNRERKLLSRAVRLRNGIIHSGVKQVRRVLKEMGYSVSGQRIIHFQLKEGPGAVESLINAVKNRKTLPTFNPEADVHGNRYAHQLQAAFDGAFDAAEKMLNDCEVLLKRALDAYQKASI